MRIGGTLIGLASALALASPGIAAAADAPSWVALPPVRYHVLKSGPADGAMPNRKDMITVNYELKLDDGKLVAAE